MNTLRMIMKWLLGVLFVAAGLFHFVRPDFYVRIMPPYLPWHLGLVYLSGVAEMLLGALVLVPRFQVLAAWGLIALLLAVLPANLHMAFNSHLYPDFPPALIWARLPFQAVLIAWVYWFTSPMSPRAESSPP